MQVQVVYALPALAVLRAVTLHEGATVGDALAASGLLRECPEIDLARNRVGLWGRLVTIDTVVGDGDRVEIYRPLVADPKEARRARAGSGGRAR